MDLTIRRILSTKDDEVLYKLLAAELSRRVQSYKDADDLFKKLQSLPIGLRAMAATYELDVSMAFLLITIPYCHFIVGSAQFRRVVFRLRTSESARSFE